VVFFAEFGSHGVGIDHDTLLEFKSELIAGTEGIYC